MLHSLILLLKQIDKSIVCSIFLPALSLVLDNNRAQYFVSCGKCRSIVTYKSASSTGVLKKYNIINFYDTLSRTFVDEMLLEYGLSLNANSFIITDNESKMVVALHGANHVDCSGHHIHKILKHSFTITKIDGIEVMQTFDVIKSLIAHFRRSHRQVKLLRKRQTFSSTRFSGAYYMMVSCP